MSDAMERAKKLESIKEALERIKDLEEALREVITLAQDPEIMRKEETIEQAQFNVITMAASMVLTKGLRDEFFK